MQSLPRNAQVSLPGPGNPKTKKLLRRTLLFLSLGIAANLEEQVRDAAAALDDDI